MLLCATSRAAGLGRPIAALRLPNFGHRGGASGAVDAVNRSLNNCVSAYRIDLVRLWSGEYIGAKNGVMG
jgi:hypothetical protein